MESAVTGGTATGGGVDYTLDAGLLSIATGDSVRTIETTLVGDDLDEPTETVIVTLSSPQNAVLGSNQSLQLLITDEIYAMYLPLVGE